MVKITTVLPISNHEWLHVGSQIHIFTFFASCSILMVSSMKRIIFIFERKDVTPESSNVGGHFAKKCFGNLLKKRNIATYLGLSYLNSGDRRISKLPGHMVSCFSSKVPIFTPLL